VPKLVINKGVFHELEAQNRRLKISYPEAPHGALYRRFRVARKITHFQRRIIMDSTNQTIKPADIRTVVRQRYGKAAAEFKPKIVSGCGCTGGEGLSPSDQAILSRIYETQDVIDLPEEVTGLSMGCGDPVTLASLQPGQTVLDLGSGGGIDCFLAAKAVGETGYVIGVDMTAEMLEKARANQARLGLQNVDFRLGEIEHLPVADGSVDIIISNCVVNLSPDKAQVFREAHRVLKPGGRIAKQDIATDGALPQIVRDSLSAWAGCVAGALDVQDYRAVIEASGFTNVQITPVYLDKALAEDMLKQIAPQEAGEVRGRKLIFNDGTGVQIIELGEDVDLGDKPLDKAIFSAKITAQKPA
jgi:arsenite methyltransferase